MTTKRSTQSHPCPTCGGHAAHSKSMSTTATAPQTDRLLTATEAARMLGIAPGTLYNLRCKDRFAPAIVLGRALRWETSDLLMWARQFKEGQAA